MKSANQVYIACPLSIGMHRVREVCMHLSNLGYRPIYWERGSTYDEKVMVESNIFVIILPSLSFSMIRRFLPRGCRTELETAETMGKPIYVAYWGLANLKIHSAIVDDRTIVGLSTSYLPEFPESVNGELTEYEIC